MNHKRKKDSYEREKKTLSQIRFLLLYVKARLQKVIILRVFLTIASWERKIRMC